MAFDVHVVDYSGRPVKGARVSISFTSVLRGMADRATDSDGHATFDGYEDGEIRVFVRGSNCGTYYYRDGDGITVAV